MRRPCIVYWKGLDRKRSRNTSRRNPDTRNLGEVGRYPDQNWNLGPWDMCQDALQLGPMYWIDALKYTYHELHSRCDTFIYLAWRSLLPLS